MGIPARQLVRFGLAGAFNTLVAYLGFSILLFMGLHYTLATLLGGLGGMAVGYRTTGGFVFDHRGESRILRFSSVFVLMYLLNIGIQRMLQTHVNPYLGGGMATVVCFLFSFVMNRAYVFKPGVEGPSSYSSAYAEVQIRRSCNPLRRWVRAFYLRDIVRYVEGPAIDIGCGSGDLLARLPAGSIGLEVNPAAVAYGCSRGLRVEPYDPIADGYHLESIPPGNYRTILFTHVLEHLEQPGLVLETIFQAGVRMGIRRVVITLPCERGFRFDPTHRTYVDESYLDRHGLLARKDFVPAVIKRFPIDVPWLGRLYTFHELRVVFVRGEAD